MDKLHNLRYHLSAFFQVIVLCFISAFLSGCAGKSDNLTILFAGDLMPDRGTRDVIGVHGMDYLFENVQNVFRNADFAVANLECVACDTTCKPADKEYTFRANPEWLSSLNKNGITHVTLANNHSCDFGEKGVKQTISNLNLYGIKPIGYSQNNNAASEPVLLKKGNNIVAVFSSCFLKQNCKSISSENVSGLSEKIKAFKAAHNSTIIIVCLHWGVEMKDKPTSEQVEQAHQLIQAGADAIIGHHPHVVQTIEVYRGKYIFYSLGNFIFDTSHSPANRGILTNITISNGGIASIGIIPFHIIKSKPCIMNEEESDKFRKEINSISKTLELKQNDGIWKVY
jgi:poly-gamma-glutamate capsule biosynthesis protein CapA/YwtB (metallophosphatase superfamily)